MNCVAASAVAWFANIAYAMDAIVQSCQNVWSPSLSACASCKSQQQAGRNQCRSFHFPILPLNSVVTTGKGCTFSRTTLRRNSGCASKHIKLFRIEKVFLTLCILFRCYSCSAMDLLKRHSSCLARLASFNKNATGSLRIGSGLKSLGLFMGIPGKMVANAAL